MDEIRDRKEVFCRLCDQYSRLPHIRSRDLFLVYADRVRKDIYLTEKMFNHFCKFCVKDYKYSKEELREYFSPLLPPKIEHSTLEPFFTKRQETVNV